MTRSNQADGVEFAFAELTLSDSIKDVAGRNALDEL